MSTLVLAPVSDFSSLRQAILPFDDAGVVGPPPVRLDEPQALIAPIGAWTPEVAPDQTLVHQLTAAADDDAYPEAA